MQTSKESESSDGDECPEEFDNVADDGIPARLKVSQPTFEMESISCDVPSHLS